MNDIESAAWATLDEVMDPCSAAFGCGLSLVEMRLVTSVEYADGDLQVGLRLTEPTCMLSFHIARTVEQRLREALGPEPSIDVRLTHDPDTVWTEDMILPSAMERLTMHRRKRALALGRSPVHVSPGNEEKV